MAGCERLRFCVPVLLIVCFLSPYVTSGAEGPPRQKRTWPRRVLPGMQSFPSREEFYSVTSVLNGSTVSPKDETYSSATVVYNRRLAANPYAVVYVKSVKDVQKMIVFAKQHNLWVTVRSSGHSFIGRSTHDGAIVIDMRTMKGIDFNLNSTRCPAGEVTVESGNAWIDVYKAVDKQVTTDDAGKVQRRVIVGGGAHNVAIGGYTQGGGHSPLSRQLGLAVDSLLEASIVLANGTVAVVNEQGTTVTDLDGRSSFTTDTSLFWAIRGGGGGTWGVVISFTFKLHFAPQRIRSVVMNWALNYKGFDIGTETIKFVTQQLTRLSSDWGGYMLITDVTGSFTLALNHWGSDDSPSNSDVDAIFNYNVTGNQYNKKDRKFNTFLEFKAKSFDETSAYIYLYDSFIQPTIVNDSAKLDQLAAFLMSLKNVPSDQSRSQCAGTLIGGKMDEIASGVTPVNPKFRSGLLAMSCALGWADGPSRDDFYINHALKMRDALAEVGEGVYFSEPAEDLDDWKVQFWGDANNYQRLLDAKRKWDPDHFFWCHNCVGSDLSATYGPIRDDDSPVDGEVECTSASASLRYVGVFDTLLLHMFVPVLYVIARTFG